MDDAMGKTPLPLPVPDGERETIAKRSSVGDEVYGILLSRLIALRIPPGARISIDSLARELGVSQTPIRAALIQLATEGLVTKTHLVGYSATPLPSHRQFEEIYQMRLLLEPFAAERAASEMDDAQRTELTNITAIMARLVAEDTRQAYGRFAHWDAKFHHLIALVGGGQLIADTLARLHTHMHLFRVLFHSAVTEGAIKEHAALIEALLARDGKQARKAMARHIEASRARVLPIIATLNQESGHEKPGPTGQA
ncbi:MAG TPA: GntR family transcriptional regulator [Stellaceae bacterium]|nr:GntR family transcriptional regulator [Stellaceae bacterium]